ncbi:MAG: hypothetical protein RPT11_11250, partial [Bermanella sp.]
SNPIQSNPIQSNPIQSNPIQISILVSGCVALRILNIRHGKRVVTHLNIFITHAKGMKQDVD